MTTVPALPKAQKPYKRYGAALVAWRSRSPEIVLAGPAGTGKSRALLEKLHFCADKYAGMRGLIVRKTRESITQTAMVTFEQKVLPDGCLGKEVHFRVSEQEYRYPNGSIIAVGGLDKSSKIMSSEWDMIYVQEATELTEEDWEALTTRLRNGSMPYQQLLADCNPSYPTHWLKLRCDRKATTLLESRHEDNPSVTNAYLARLDNLTGVRKERLRYGKWVAAEGMVYEEWERARHIVSLAQLIRWAILTPDEKVNPQGVKQVIGGCDWGFTNPGILHVWAIDADLRQYLIREIYQTGKTIDWWIAQAQELKRLYGIEKFICDPSEPAYIEQFYAAGLPAIGGTNDIAPGISSVQARLKDAGDGRPRLFVYESSVKVRDESRARIYAPWCFEQEIEAYAWPKSRENQPIKEVPVKVNDHAMDACRYVSMYLDGPRPRGGMILDITSSEDDEAQDNDADDTSPFW